MYARNFPTFLTDRLIKSLTDIGVELAITIHAEPYEPSSFMRKINNADTTIKAEMVKAQRSGAQEGVDSRIWLSQVEHVKFLSQRNDGKKRLMTMTKKPFQV